MPNYPEPYSTKYATSETRACTFTKLTQLLALLVRNEQSQEERLKKYETQLLDAGVVWHRMVSEVCGLSCNVCCVGDYIAILDETVL